MSSKIELNSFSTGSREFVTEVYNSGTRYELLMRRYERFEFVMNRISPPVQTA